jgi:hypothetical protein
MTLTRWKLMAGVLGLSMCGLAALAEPACRTVGYTHRQTPDVPPPVADAGSKPLPPPVNVPPPAPSTLPPAPASLPSLPPPATLPKADSAPPPATEVPPAKPTLPPLPGPGELPKGPDLPPPALPDLAPASPPAGGLSEKAFTDLAKQNLQLQPLPTLSEKKPETLPSPKPELPKSDAALPPPVVTFAPAPTPEPLPTKPAPKAELPLTPSPVVTSEPVRVSATTAAVPAERKLKVQMHLGSGKPYFEVRDGEELVLKVVSDAVEVKAPAENGDAASVLKASGGVSFRTLGGNGTCDELRVVPGTGEVVVSGRVAVTSNWGKAETTATADKMTFRLGADAPAKK